MHEVTRLSGIEYAPGLLLDIVRPDVDGPLPVIIWLHGGAWRMGDRTGAPHLDRHFAADGFAMVSIDYRLSGEARFPAPLHDVRRAVRWVRAHASDLGFDADRIGLWGSSAGGHLAALAGVTSWRQALPGETDTDVSAAVQAVVDGYGPADLTTPDQAVPPTEALLGGPVAENLAAAREASPALQVADAAPPFLIMHGTADPLMPPSQSERLFDALATRGHDATLYLIEGFGHGFFNPADTPEPGPETGITLDSGRLEAEPDAACRILHAHDGTTQAAAGPPASLDVIRDFFSKALARHP
ncbi:alpha/beta hydrolase [Microbacterium sp. STN6]|uniref:alpha/beta hydrolase n=1 Tax=Microbacterium sp. STN6 TaxID=2995588 RepID=UPI002260E563|nr:alpha/beta hydrolase [Microbacterium sp. STN6]MCX7520768.1 alpha/beta hydrolase [Microbacterium sp. STN6]